MSTVYVVHQSQMFSHVMTAAQAETYVATTAANFPDTMVEVS